jgi:protein TonB
MGFGCRIGNPIQRFYAMPIAKSGIEGRVIIQFIVDEEGRPTHPRVVRGIGGGCDEEALRATRTIRFKPGRQRGKVVKVKMSLPVTFRLD